MADQDGKADTGLKDLDALLDGIAQYVADSSDAFRAGLPVRSGRLYSAVTRYWPRTAVGMVAVVAVADLIIGGLTANNALEFYMLAWATITVGLWFLFEKIERIASLGTKTEMSSWLLRLDPADSIRTWPESFVA